MARTLVTNHGNGSVTLPPPYGQMIAAGDGVVLGDDPPTVIANLGGELNVARNGLTIQATASSTEQTTVRASTAVRSRTITAPGLAGTTGSTLTINIADLLPPGSRFGACYVDCPTAFTDGAVKQAATLALASCGNGAMSNVVLTSNADGAAGNADTLALAADSVGGAYISVDGVGDYVLHIEDGVSTRDDAATALAGTFALTGAPASGGTVLTGADAFAAVNFSGGVDGPPEVRLKVGANGNADAIIGGGLTPGMVISSAARDKVDTPASLTDGIFIDGAQLTLTIYRPNGGALNALNAGSVRVDAVANLV